MVKFLYFFYSVFAWVGVRLTQNLPFYHCIYVFQCGRIKSRSVNSAELAQLPSARCSFILKLTVKFSKQLRNLDPRSPTSFSLILLLVTVHGWLVHPLKVLQLKLGIISFRASPEFDSNSRSSVFPENTKQLWTTLIVR